QTSPLAHQPGMVRPVCVKERSPHVRLPRSSRRSISRSLATFPVVLGEHRLRVGLSYLAGLGGGVASSEQPFASLVGACFRPAAAVVPDACLSGVRQVHVHLGGAQWRNPVPISARSLLRRVDERARPDRAELRAPAPRTDFISHWLCPLPIRNGDARANVA